MARPPRPISTRALSRAMMVSSVRSMRWTRKASWPSVAWPLARASRHSFSAACSMRGRAWRGCSPASAATSSRLRPEPMASSKRLASRFRPPSRNSLSRMMLHDHSDASASPIITSFTTQSARTKMFTRSKLSGERAAAGFI